MQIEDDEWKVIKFMDLRRGDIFRFIPIRSLDSMIAVVVAEGLIHCDDSFAQLTLLADDGSIYRRRLFDLSGRDTVKILKSASST